MKNNSMMWLIVMIVGAALLGLRWTLASHGFGKAYVEVTEETRYRIPGEKVYETDDPIDMWVTEAAAAKSGVDTKSIPADRIRIRTTTEGASYSDYMTAQSATPPAGGAVPSTTRYEFSVSRTVGIWFAAFMTLFVMTFLIGDNPLYKVAESIFIGVSAGYWMVVGFWSTLVPNLLAKIWPDAIRHWAMPGLSSYDTNEWLYLVPLALGIMLLWRLSPKGGWISRWPMAFIIGVFCGMRLITFLAADFVSQIRTGIVSLWVNAPQLAADGTVMHDAAGNVMTAFDFWLSLRNVFLVVGVFTCLVYFFFSIEHKGIVGKTARVGIWFLMITFGAAFGYTVMGRIALLAIRFEFLFDDWLWLIDPKGVHTIADATSLILPFFGLG